MYIVSIFRQGKEYKVPFSSPEEAVKYSRIFWHLSPVIRTPDNSVLTDGESCASRF